MARNTSITLGEHFDEFVSRQIEWGRYSSVSEVVRAGLRLLENSENKLQVLRQMLAAGEQSGLADYTYSSLVTELDEESNTDIQGDL